MCARLSVGRSLDEPESVDEMLKARGVKIVLAGIIARYPYGGVTWCSLMYLLGLRALGPRGLLHRGHRRVHLRPGAERALDRSRPTAPTTSTSALEPFGLGDRWSFVNYDGTYHGASRETVRALVRRRRSLHQPVGRILVLARRVRAHPAQGVHRHAIRCSRSSRSPRATPGTWTSSAASIGCSPSAPTSAPRRATCRPAASPGTTPGSRWSPSCGAPTRRRAIASRR